jgi:hypothetical protein
MNTAFSASTSLERLVVTSRPEYNPAASSAKCKSPADHLHSEDLDDTRPEGAPQVCAPSPCAARRRMDRQRREGRVALRQTRHKSECEVHSLSGADRERVGRSPADASYPHVCRTGAARSSWDPHSEGRYPRLTYIHIRNDLPDPIRIHQVSRPGGFLPHLGRGKLATVRSDYLTCESVPSNAISGDHRRQ